MNNEPTKKDLERDDFGRVWKAIKKWDIQREEGTGYAGATGTDVMIILNALKKEEKKTLSDKIIDYGGKSIEIDGKNYHCLSVEDVKIALKEFMKSIWLRPNPSNMKQHYKDAKRIFGDKLI